MTLQNARLLIIVENADYRPHLLTPTPTDSQLAEAFWGPESSLEAIDALGLEEEEAPEVSVEPLDAIASHILQAALHWRSHLQDVAIFSAHSVLPYSVATPAGIRLIGSGIAADSDEAPHRKPNQLVADFCPTHIVFCAPTLTVLRWANANHIPSVVLLWEWQEPLGRQQKRLHGQLIKALNNAYVNWVGSHGISACKILETSGISARKIIPWRWSQAPAQSRSPAPFWDQRSDQLSEQPQEQFQPKQLRYDRQTIELLYVGAVDERACLIDLLLAMRHMQSQGTDVHLKLLYEVASGVASGVASEVPGTVGAAPAAVEMSDGLASALADLRSHIAVQGLSAQVTLQPLAHPRMTIQSARAADLVVIPGAARSNPANLSAIEFARAARTPIVAADFAAPEGELFHSVNAMIFPAGNAKSMAHRIERIMGQPQLYAQISDALEVTLDTIKIPARWTSLIDYWLNSADTIPAGKDNHQRLCNWAMSSGRYSQL